MEEVQELSNTLASCGIPKAVKLGGHTFRVGSLHPFVSSNGSSEGTILGICNFMNNEIGIVDGINPSRAWSTLVHEVLEAICEMNQIDIEHKDIQCIETGFFDFLANNPEMLMNLNIFLRHEEELSPKKPPTQKKRSK